METQTAEEPPPDMDGFAGANQRCEQRLKPTAWQSGNADGQAQNFGIFFVSTFEK